MSVLQNTSDQLLLPKAKANVNDLNFDSKSATATRNTGNLY